ncbi:MAG: TonB-dependent receptor plug domain-containing protein, partial [Sedimenticola sp.]|nr:TonB-dependent receptor plug domain-containing protein [Sedimenticola sp.]
MDGDTPLAEELFFSDVPVVLSATRLDQPLTDTPAAVTVIDRSMIEASGAIELADLFRLVPGFQVGFYTG